MQDITYPVEGSEKVTTGDDTADAVYLDWYKQVYMPSVADNKGYKELAAQEDFDRF